MLQRAPKRSAAVCLAMLALLPMLAGCQASVMIGRVLFGDTPIPPKLTQRTGIELEEGTHRVHLACTAPASVLGRYDALQIDLVSEVARRLRKREIPITQPDRVAEKIDEMGGRFEPRELAAQFDEGLFVHVNIEQFQLKEQSSTNLHRGRCIGQVVGYEIRGADDDRGEGVIEVFSSEIRLDYPGTHPIPADQMSDAMFKRKYLAKLADEVGRMLYPYRMTETF